MNKHSLYTVSMMAILLGAVSILSAEAALVTNWSGLDLVNTPQANVPPDPHGAAGPNGIIQTVNSSIAYWDKGGNQLWSPLSLIQFFPSAAGVPFDTKVLFDPASQRFFVVDIDLTIGHSYCNVAVSKSNNPGSSSTTDWYTNRFETTELLNGSPCTADYTCIGIDSNALYVTFNMRDTNYIVQNCAICVLKKSSLITGSQSYLQGIIYTHPHGIGNGLALQPVTPIGASLGNVAIFAETPYSISFDVRFWAVTNILSTPGLVVPAVTVSIPNNGGAIGDAPQQGTTNLVETLSPFTQGNAFCYSNAVWFCNTAGGTAGYSKVYYYKVNLNGYPNGTPTLSESGAIDGGANVWNYQPAIGGNTNGDICMVFCQSSSTSYPSVFYTYRNASATSFSTPTLLKASSTYLAQADDRWGDYATVAADPKDGTFWITHELMNDTVSHQSWSTIWGQISVP